MSALWIAGFAILLSTALFFALVLCKCAVLADRDAGQYLADKEPSSPSCVEGLSIDK